MAGNIYGTIGKTIGTIARLAYPIYSAGSALNQQQQYVKQNITRSLTENATTGGAAGAVGALVSKQPPGPAAVVGVVAGVAVAGAKVIHDSWYETPVVSAVTGAAKAIGQEVWRRYTE